MKVLVGCEFSQVICKAFREQGHEAYSCDFIPCEGGHPEWHIQGNVLDHINDGWDILIAHPTCTHLCRHYARWEAREDITDQRAYDRWLFIQLLEADIPMRCIENPVPLKISDLPPYTQIIQPWQFGHDYSKKTCLWLRNLPKLKPTKIVELTYYYTPNGRKFTYGWYKTPRNGKARSITFQGIANAMAQQWGAPE